MVGEQEDRPAVHTCRESYTYGTFFGFILQPFFDLFIHRPDIQFADLFHRHIFPFVAFGGKKTLELGRRVGAAQQMDRSDVVGRRHTRIGRMELVIHALLFQEIVNGINAFGQYQQRTVCQLGDEKTQRHADGAGHADDLAFDGKKGELPVDLTDSLRVSRPDQLTGLLNAHVVNDVLGWIGQINDTVHIFLVYHFGKIWFFFMHQERDILDLLSGR